LIHFTGNQKDHENSKFNYWLLLTFANKSKIEKVTILLLLMMI